MGNLTKNLSRYEFACRCKCGFDTVDSELVNVLQAACDYFEDRYSEPIKIIISGPNRCVQHNKDEGGAADSQHIYARGADHKLFLRRSGKQIQPDEVADYYEDVYAGKYGIGRYHNRTHLDTRTDGPARWEVKPDQKEED